MRTLLALVAADRLRIEGALGARRGLSTLRVHGVFARRVTASTPMVSKATGLTPPTVSSAIDALEKLGIVREVTARQRNRQFVYDSYLRVLDGQGIEPNRVEP
jgi:DNA-binding transcriptional ArsR family regulator